MKICWYSELRNLYSNHQYLFLSV